mgnify:CR=1 FL=1
MDLSYGWQGFVFDLRQARVSAIVEFQEQNSDGGRDIRKALISSDINEEENAEWKARDSVRYSAPRRSLSANARWWKVTLELFIWVYRRTGNIFRKTAIHCTGCR